jgi:hypothetical protein
MFDFDFHFKYCFHLISFAPPQSPSIEWAKSPGEKAKQGEFVIDFMFDFDIDFMY